MDSVALLAHYIHTSDGFAARESEDFHLFRWAWSFESFRLGFGPLAGASSGRSDAPWIDAATAQPTRQSSQWLSGRVARSFHSSTVRPRPSVRMQHSDVGKTAPEIAAQEGSLAARQATKCTDREYSGQDWLCWKNLYRTVKYLLIRQPMADILPVGNVMKTQTPTQLGAAIRSRRKQLKITQKELAMACGTGLRFIVDLEKGKPTCQVGKTLQVLQSLGLAIEITTMGGHETGSDRP